MNVNDFASWNMFIFHLVNFISLELFDVIRYILYQDTTPYPKRPTSTLVEDKVLEMICKTYFTYMTFVLFYLVYCFGKNKQLGETLC